MSDLIIDKTCISWLYDNRLQIEIPSNLRGPGVLKDMLAGVLSLIDQEGKVYVTSAMFKVDDLYLVNAKDLCNISSGALNGVLRFLLSDGKFLEYKVEIEAKH